MLDICARRFCRATGAQLPTATLLAVHMVPWNSKWLLVKHGDKRMLCCRGSLCTAILHVICVITLNLGW